MDRDEPVLEEGEQQRVDAENAARERAEQAGAPSSLSLCLTPRRAAAAAADTTTCTALPYRWRQTLQDLSISVPVPQGTRSRDLQVSLMRSKLSVGLKGKDPILHGELFKDIRVDDSTWTLGTRPMLSLYPTQCTDACSLADRGRERGVDPAREARPAGMVAARRHERAQDRHDQDPARELAAERPRS